MRLLGAKARSMQALNKHDVNRTVRSLPTYLLSLVASSLLKFSAWGQPAGLRLSFARPAARWTEAFPLGNGRLGAMDFGGVEDMAQFGLQLCIPNMATRLKDIADHLGLYVVTVSRVLRNHPDIGEETRERVLQRVKEVNYETNILARSLVTG